MKEKDHTQTTETIEYVWHHPDNNCPNLSKQPTITKIISASGRSQSEAIRYTKVLAENSRVICAECKQDYTLR